jgi:geranylgeranyl diphosphate synthase type II
MEGGKRIRPMLVLLSCEAAGGRAALADDAAVAIEMMHNFTLVHDDIMDNADARRGRPTVHTTLGVNTALLVGDVLLGSAYASLRRTPGERGSELAAIFTRGLLDVCEGQALDLEFEQRTDVTIREYFRMIGKKTASLIATATELGGVTGGATARQREALRRFGLSLGRAFQVQDDLLDVVADPRDFGKTTGGDILEGKRTYLLITAASRATGDDLALMTRLLAREGSRTAWKSPDGQVTAAGRAIVEAATDVYRRCGVLDEARRVVQRSTADALRNLSRLRPSRARDDLRQLAQDLVTRAS